jgi:ribosomal protein S18 acetylase RimI-like enzyme
MKIRKAKNQDWPAILNLMRQLIEEHHALDKYYKSFAQYQKLGLKNYIQESIKNPDKVFLVAEENNKILGYFLGTIEEAPYYSSEKKIGVIADTAVEKLYRQKGILRSLFQEALRWFKKENIKFIELSVDARNNAAVSAWKNLGFKDYKLRLQFKNLK